MVWSIPTAQRTSCTCESERDSREPQCCPLVHSLDDQTPSVQHSTLIVPAAVGEITIRYPRTFSRESERSIKKEETWEKKYNWENYKLRERRRSLIFECLLVASFSLVCISLWRRFVWSRFLSVFFKYFFSLLPAEWNSPGIIRLFISFPGWFYSSRCSWFH